MSGIYIKGMEMPRCCAECKIEGHYEDSYGYEYGFFCPMGYKAYTSETRETKRLDDCPLIPVPDHGRLIDAHALEETFRERKRPTLSDGADGSKERVRYLDFISALQAIKDAPTIIPADKEEEP